MSAEAHSIIYWIVILIIVIVAIVVLFKVLNIAFAIMPYASIGEEKLILNSLILRP